ncbi:MAG: aldose epimerase family protein [Bacteroidota bacterium]
MLQRAGLLPVARGPSASVDPKAAHRGGTSRLAWNGIGRHASSGPMIEPGPHTLPDGRTAEVVEISGGGLRARIATLGAALLNLWAPDIHGRLGDVVLGHATLADYLDDPAYLGVAVGRTAGRIAGATVTVDGTPHRLDANDSPNTLHGGPHGLSAAVWTLEERATDRVVLAVSSPAGAGGYPGRLAVRLGVALREIAGAPTLALDWHATTDAPTLVALTHHGYWNLDGHGAGPVTGHVLQSDAPRYLALNGLLPTGETPVTEGTALDLRQPRALADVLAEEAGPVTEAGGLDHDLFLPPFGERQAALRRALHVANATGTRAMEVWTTEPCVHLYDGLFLDGSEGKDGARYESRSGLAIETQPPPDATRIVDRPRIPSVILRPGEVLASRTEFRFVP